MIATGLPGTAVYRIDRLRRRLSRVIPPRSLLSDQPLASFTTYRVGGPARLWATADSAAEMTAIARAVAAESAESGCEPVPVLVLGRGSNLLVADRGFDGLVVTLGPGLKRFQIPVAVASGDRVGHGSDAVITAGGGTPVPALARACASAGLRGFEWAVGVPGTVGGAVRMNAGCHGSDMASILVDATVVDLHTGSTSVRSASSLGLGYRISDLAHHHVVVGVRVRLVPGDIGEARAELARVTSWRRDNQPGGRNAGSVFTNPVGDSAGRLIDAVGAKGLRIGTASVSVKHANFIQSDQMGKADDIVAVMTEVRRRVSSACGTDLRVETCLVGFEREEVTGLP